MQRFRGSEQTGGRRKCFQWRRQQPVHLVLLTQVILLRAYETDFIIHQILLSFFGNNCLLYTAIKLASLSPVNFLIVRTTSNIDRDPVEDLGAVYVRFMCGVCAVFVLFWCDFGAVFVLFWCGVCAVFQIYRTYTA